VGAVLSYKGSERLQEKNEKKLSAKTFFFATFCTAFKNGIEMTVV